MKRVILAILFPVTAWATPPSTPVTAATNQQTITVGGSASSSSLNGLASSAETTLSGGVASSGSAGLGQSSAPQGYGGQSGTVAATGHVGYISDHPSLACGRQERRQPPGWGQCSTLA